MKRILKNNGLSIAFAVIFLFSILLQIHFGRLEYNKLLTDHGIPAVSLNEYLQTGHFVESTFENWESEFLQMALYVLLTIFLMQRGSSESKRFDGTDDSDRKPEPTAKDAPYPVRKGGWLLILYKNSLTSVLVLFFVISMVLHFFGSLYNTNKENELDGKPLESVSEYLVDSTFWFESFQNWQSEFLSVFTLIVLSIYLRQYRSPQSKPVDAPHYQTGE